jgi:DNA-directed RNA polymerase specialized sigma24 family protein
LVGFGEGEAGFTAFVAEVEPTLRRVLMVHYGQERGREAAAEALAYAWEHWTRVREMQNPGGYLYRVGQSRTHSRKHPVAFDRPISGDIWIEPELPGALGTLPANQRIAVVLVHGFDTPVTEVARILGVRPATVHTHLRRGLSSLRKLLGAGSVPTLPATRFEEPENRDERGGHCG